MKETKTCEFCQNFDFSKVRAYIDRGTPKIELAICNTSFTKDEQFSFCPVCGRPLK